jgi:hypothetical protein
MSGSWRGCHSVPLVGHVRGGSFQTRRLLTGRGASEFVLCHILHLSFSGICVCCSVRRVSNVVVQEGSPLH